MKEKPGREPRSSRTRRSAESRESALASGWTVEGDADPASALPDPAAASGRSVAAPAATAVDSGLRNLEAERGDVAASTPEGAAGDELASGEEALIERSQISNGALVVLGVFGGLYLLYTWGWFIVAQAYSALNAFTAAGSGLIGGVLQQVVFWAAPMAPPLWFFVALALSRGGRTKRLAILLIIGAVVLLPLPMLIARGA